LGKVSGNKLCIMKPIFGSIEGNKLSHFEYNKTDSSYRLSYYE
jgi:hypothetical protein